MDVDECPEDILKTLCCTCLSSSRDRKLFQLCRLVDGVNNLYLLLSYDSEAYREGFYKDMASLYICWECKAIMWRITCFRKQACMVQKQLSAVMEGRHNKSTAMSLTQLSTHYKTTYDLELTSLKDSLDNFIDCGIDIKVEDHEDDMDDLDDIPLSELHYKNTETLLIDAVSLKEESLIESPSTKFKKRKNTIDNKLVKKKLKIEKKSGKSKTSSEGKKSYYGTIKMNEEEMLESWEKKKMAAIFVDAQFKCELCLEVFRTPVYLKNHVEAVHTEKENHTQCDVCRSYINNKTYQEHWTSHYKRYVCHFCDYVAYGLSEIMKHLKSGHSIQKIHLERKRGQGKKPPVLNPGSKPRRNKAMLDKRTPFGYLCEECNKYFDTKNQRWKHVQRFHREGFKCTTCGKRFAFKNNLTRHEVLHKGPPPREECPVCHKMIRCDLVKMHAVIHTRRDTFSCVECDKQFVSRASYEHHLKYTQAHAREDILKYKCSMCDKGYRSRGELRDHVNYQHMGKTQHTCPVCGKALATRRCITRHVRRAHHGVKEYVKDKICQQCGKAFRDKKGLREHEHIHTGERPLSCEVCGCTFRQSASLYTHKKRVHKMCTARRSVQVVQSHDRYS